MYESGSNINVPCSDAYPFYSLLIEDMTTRIPVHNVFSIGFRCNSDEFLSKYLAIRKYSSPFSYMVIDIKTSLTFMEHRFENYTNRDYIKPGINTVTFNKQPWACNQYHACSVITDPYGDVLEMDTVCLWNHHNLYDDHTIQSLERRSRHLLECMDTKPETTLFLYIERIQEYGEKPSYFDKSLLDKTPCQFLILIPLLNFDSDPIVHYDDSRVRIIYFRSNRESWATDTSCHIEEWHKLERLIRTLYDFSIEDRED